MMALDFDATAASYLAIVVRIITRTIKLWNTLPSELLNSSDDVDDQDHTFHILKKNLLKHLY